MLSNNKNFVKSQISNCGQYEKGTILIGDEYVVVFRHTGSNEYFYSQTSLTTLTKKGESTARDFLASKWLKAALPNGFQPATCQFKNVTYKLWDITLSTKFFIFQSTQGNSIATKIVHLLAEESLKIRACGAFTQLPTDIVKIQEDTNKTLTDERLEAKRGPNNNIA